MASSNRIGGPAKAGPGAKRGVDGLRTALCDMLGMDVPVFQASIGGAACPDLAAAVSEAGGMGSIALTGWGREGAADRLQHAARLTTRGIVGNVILHYDVEGEIAAMLDHPPKVASFFWGDVTPHVERFHAAGTKVMASVGSVAEARAAVEAGADIVVAQGWEAGGHVRGMTATMALIPAVVDAVAPVPVVAAGGIADGRGLAAALCLGAQAVWIGTRFLSAEEADIHPVYRDRVLAADAADTVHCTAFDGGWEGAPGRVLRNRSLEAWEAAGRPAWGGKPGQGDVVARDGSGAPIHRYDAVTARRELTGDIGELPLWAGQGVGLVSRRQQAAEIVDELVREAEAALSRLRGNSRRSSAPGPR